MGFDLQFKNRYPTPMFTGIVKGQGVVKSIDIRPGLHIIKIELPAGGEVGLETGASVSVDGVCLTVTNIADLEATFDVMLETLNLTTLGDLKVGSRVNVERAAKDGAEIGGHAISGHIDTTVAISKIEQPDNNYVITFSVPERWMRYIFNKGYVALNGTSLTITSVDKKEHTFSVWLIPETLKLTTFGDKKVGDKINLEVERGTQVTVDTIRDYLDEKFLELSPQLEALIKEPFKKALST